MKLEQLANRIDAGAAQAFVRAARHVIDAMLIEGQRVAETQAPTDRDYARAELPNAAPPQGWISRAELDQTVQRFTEALASEKWTDGVVFAIRALTMLS